MPKAKERVVETEQDQAEQDLQQRQRHVEQQLAQSLLDGEGVEEAVHQFRQVTAGYRFGLDPRNAVSELEGATGEEPLLDVLRQRQLHDLHRPGKAHANGDERDEHAPTRSHLPAADQVDDGLHAQRNAQADRAAHQGVQIDVADLALVHTEQLGEALPGVYGIHRVL